mgnify:CR=1 FL=1
MKNLNNCTTACREFPEIVDSVNRLKTWAEELLEKPVKEAFGSQVNRGAPFSFQVLATLRHTSAGAIRDSWVKYELTEKDNADVLQFILDNAVVLTAEELKAKAERAKHLAEVHAKAVSYIETCELNDIKLNAVAVKKNAKLLAKFGQEVVDEIVNILTPDAE